jgi:hypothetical protein
MNVFKSPTFFIPSRRVPFPGDAASLLHTAELFVVRKWRERVAGILMGLHPSRRKNGEKKYKKERKNGCFKMNGIPGLAL